MTVILKYVVDNDGVINLHSTQNTEKSELLESDRSDLLNEASKIINEFIWKHGVYLEAIFDLEILDVNEKVERTIECIVSMSRSTFLS